MKGTDNPLSDIENPSLLDLVRDSFSFSKEHFGEISAIALKWILAPILLYVILIVGGHSMPTLLVVLSGILIPGFMTLALYAYGGITEIAIANVQKREVRFRFGRAGAIFWVTILVLLMEMVFTVPLQLAKLTFIATIVDLFFTIRFGLLSQVIVAEDTNVDAIARSWNLWKGNGGFLASRMIGFYLMVIAALGVPSLVLFFSFGGITSKLNPGGAPNWPLFALVCLLIAIPALYFSLYIDPYFKARLYQQVRGRRLMVAPTPAAPSVGRELYDFNP